MQFKRVTRLYRFRLFNTRVPVRIVDSLRYSTRAEHKTRLVYSTVSVCQWNDGFIRQTDSTQRSEDESHELRVTSRRKRPHILYTNFFVTFLSWIYWLGTHAFNAAGHMGALL